MSESYRAIVSFDESTPPTQSPLLLRPDGNLRTGVDDFAAVFPDPTSLERDLLVLASTIYSCDLAFKRGEREDFARSIEASIPVVNKSAFERLKDDLIEILWILSHDSWKLYFSRLRGAPEPATDWPQLRGKTLLFSGGLDSLAGAVDLFDDLGPDGVLLTSHVTANRTTIDSQNNLSAYLERKYKAQLQRVTVRTGGRKYRDLDFPSYDDREETQRTRSFMFLAIAAIAARRSGHHEVVMIAENGQMAIHLPLSAARIGAFSTHTAHPDFVEKVALFFSRLLDFEINIINPYLYKTKAEVITKLVADHKEAVGMSVSCWRGSRLSKGYNHCGDCVPCLIRRVSLEAHSLTLKEYERDLLAENIASLAPDDEGKRNAVELAEFVYTFSSRNKAELLSDYPDLISQNINFDDAIAMYRRFAGEAQRVLNRYPGIAGVLSSVVAPPSPSLGSLGPQKMPNKKVVSQKSSRKKRS